MSNNDYWCRVGDIVIPADGSAYVGKVVRIDDTHVQHECVRTGRIQTWDARKAYHAQTLEIRDGVTLCIACGTVIRREDARLPPWVASREGAKP